MSITKRRLVAPAVALVALLVAACTQPPTGGDAPAGNAIYTPPNPLRGSQPGDVQWWRSFNSGDFANAKLYTILYRSIDALGAPMAVSGTVLVPNAAWVGTGPRPILTFAPQTVGMTDDCAASRAIAGANGGGWSENPNLQAALAKGWAVAVTDYQGLGTPGRHTYMVRKAQGQAVLDAARAAQRLTDAGLSTQAPVVIWGSPQGGGAAAAAAELAATYAPELQVKGTAAGGVPADLIAVDTALNGGFYGFALIAAQGFDAAYPELQLRTYLNAAGMAEWNRLGSDTATGGCLWTVVLNYMGRRVTDYATVNVPTLPAWRARLDESKLGTIKPSAPVYLYHSALDEVIPNAVGRGLQQRWCALGTNVMWGDVFSEHLFGNGAGIANSITYLNDRINGVPVTRTC